METIHTIHNKNPSQTCTRRRLELVSLFRVETRYFVGHKKDNIPAFYKHLSPTSGA